LNLDLSDSAVSHQNQQNPASAARIKPEEATQAAFPPPRAFPPIVSDAHLSAARSILAARRALD
jgi:hypothetical protein